jgi:hypothetical protein
MFNALEKLYQNNLTLDEKNNPFLLKKEKEKESNNQK